MAIVPLTEPNGNPVVQYYEAQNFSLKSGRVVPKVRLGFCVYGKDDAPLIVLHTAVSGNPKASVVEKSGYGDGWWSRHFGPGNMLDTDRYRIMCVSHFGGNGPSTTAAELESLRFDLSILDTCRLAAEALRSHGVNKILAAIGVSMGAAVAREWLFQPHVVTPKIVEIFGNFGNNYLGAVAKNYCHIQIDLLHSDGSDLDEIRKRIDENCGEMKRESPAFAVAYDHVMCEFETLYDNFSDENVLRVTRMIGFFRFVTPHFFQQKWDTSFNETMDSEFADNEIKKMCNHLGDSFVTTFKRVSLGSLRFMDAQPRPINPHLMANCLVQRFAEILGLIVRGDRLYDSNHQFEQYEKIRAILGPANKHRVKIHLCTNLLRGHDHFLSDEFADQGKIIADFLKAPPIEQHEIGVRGQYASVLDTETARQPKSAAN